jgi:ribosomal protein L37AE/L43A
MAMPPISAPQDGERKAELPLMKMLKKIKRVKIHKGHVPINSKSIIQDIRSQYHSTKYSSKIAARQSKLLANMRHQSQCSQRMEAAPVETEESINTCGKCHKPKRGRSKKRKRRIDASPARFENGRAKSAQPQLKGMSDGVGLVQSDGDNEEALYRQK